MFEAFAALRLTDDEDAALNFHAQTRQKLLSVLSEAVEQNDTEILRHYGPLAVHDSIGATLELLNKATVLGHTECVFALLNVGVDAEAVDKFGKTALHAAVEAKNVETLKLLLERTEHAVHHRDACSLTPLHVAVQSRYAPAVKCLAPHSRLDWPAQFGQNIFHLAASNSHHQTILIAQAHLPRQKCVELIFSTDQYGRLPIEWAVMNKSVECTALLLRLTPAYAYPSIIKTVSVLVGHFDSTLCTISGRKVFDVLLAAGIVNGRILSAASKAKSAVASALNACASKQRRRVRRPLSLKHLCRMHIRENMRASVLHETLELPLPPACQRFLLFDQDALVFSEKEWTDAV